MSENDKEFAGLNKLQLFKVERVIGVYSKSLVLIFPCLTTRPVPQILLHVMARLSVTNELESICGEKKDSDVCFLLGNSLASDDGELH
jgi:hypothetical protein